MKRRSTIQVSILLFSLVFSCFSCFFATCGLAFYLAVDQDSDMIMSYRQPVRKRIRRYRMLPPLPSTPVEVSNPAPAASEPDLGPGNTSTTEATELPQNEALAQAEAIAAEVAPAEPTSSDPVGPDPANDGETQTEPQPVIPPAIADTSMAEGATPSQAEPPAATPLATADTSMAEDITPPHIDPPAQAALAEPASVPDTAFFDDLLDQVRQ